MFNDQQIEQIKKIVDQQLRHAPSPKIMQSDIPPQTIKRRHIEDVVIVFGMIANRPVDGSKGIRAYFATDTGVLGCWSGSNWLEATLT